MFLTGGGGVEGGDAHYGDAHYGILQNSFSGDKIELVVNTDDVPVFKCRNVQLWPVLCKSHFFNPFLVAKH